MRLILLSAAFLASGIASAATPVNGWYSSVFGGYTNLPSNINTLNYALLRDQVGYKNGYNAGGRVGYQSNPIRYEAEYTYINGKTKHFDINHVRQTGVSGSATGNFLMANLYYDFPDMLPAISPYLGVGIGYAYLETSLHSYGPFGRTYFKANDSAFAYQGTAGITYNFSENYAVNIAYRYTATNKVDTLGKAFQANMANFGVVYRFDQVNYK
ncbi:MAG: outer membrane beta-barrel protein [bacterium]|nr:outer membrane beta-barrel protein [bacterium]